MCTLLLTLLLLADAPATAPSPSPSPSPGAKAVKRGAPPAKPAPEGRKPPARVMTNEDLEKTREGGAAVSNLKIEGLEEPPAEAAPAEGEADASGAPKESVWRARADAARQRIADADAAIARIEAHLGELRDDRSGQDAMNPNREQARQAQIAAETENLATARADAAAAREALAELEDEARKAGVPPGWLRER
jgi:hypothetical protein